MRTRLLFNALLMLGVLACGLPIILCFAVTYAASVPPPRPAGDAVAIVYVEGPIITGDSEFSSEGVALSGTIVNHLHSVKTNESIKAVVLRVDSPGGSVIASREIYDAVMQVRASGKPVVASLGEIAASGGYYIVAGADVIYAHPATLTGSIGVISVFRSIEGLSEKIGVKFTVIKSGPHKDETFGYRDLTAEERAIWQTLINEVYEDFVSVVAHGRNLTPERVRQLGDGRVYTGRQAQAVGLVNDLGDLEDAVKTAASLAGMSGTPRRIEFRNKPGFFGSLASMFSPKRSVPALTDLFALEHTGRILYLYIAP
ncbi:MAG: signal peptide peptidase SppA [Anaerolineae bacterium]|nr:signal peptide peptidase SppA [Anaerolineae bacterium]